MIRTGLSRLASTLRIEEPDLAQSQLAAFSRQIPVLYGILTINAALLGATHFMNSPLLLSTAVPLLLATICLPRGIVWMRRRTRSVTDAEAVAVLRNTMRLVPVLGIAFSAWSLSLYGYGNLYARFHVVFYMAVTTMSCIFCLTHVRGAALLLTGIAVVPLIGFLCLEGPIVFAAIAMNLLLVTCGMLFVLLRNYDDFAALIRSQRELRIGAEETRRLSDENFRLANLDILTGLPNRRNFLSELDRIRDTAAGAGIRFAVALVDLDGFKTVNDVHGHLVGDELLSEVGKRLRGVAGPTVLTARLGGDEFGAILSGDPSDAEILAFGRGLCATLNAPFLVSTIGIVLSGSTGLVAYPDGGETADQLFERADYALYHAKQTRNGDAVIFSHEHERLIREEGGIEQALRHADLSSEMWLAFQPIHDVRRNRTIGFESLARWNSPTLGVIGPGTFIPIAERARMIGRLTPMLLGKALAAVATWPADYKISFNLSAQDLTTPATIALVRQLVLDSAIAVSRIDIEITETAVMQDFAQAEEALTSLRQIGLRISLDDFGTGFSSLSHVHRLKPDRIKIDRSFVTDIETSDTSRDIVMTIIELCRNLGIECVVEGVETEAQRYILERLGCRLMQGYLYGRPMPNAIILDGMVLPEAAE